MIRLLSLKTLLLLAQISCIEACCPIFGFVDSEPSFLVPIAGVACLKVEVYPGGVIRGDTTDDTCTAQNFLPGSVAIFEDYNSNVATYSAGQLGYKAKFILYKDFSLTENQYDITVGGQLLVIEVAFPECPSFSQKGALIDLYQSTNGDNWTFSFNWLSNEISICLWFGVTCDSDGFATEVRLAFNNLSGSIPESIGALTSLTYLFMSGNSLTGTIPQSIGDLTELTYANFDSGNTLTGTIPLSVGNLNKLTYLAFRNNALSGSIPASVGGLSSMVNLYWDENELTGTIPSAFGDLSSLNFLYLHNNNLSGTLPSEVCDLGLGSNFIYFGNDIEGVCD